MRFRNYQLPNIEFNYTVPEGESFFGLIDKILPNLWNDAPDKKCVKCLHKNVNIDVNEPLINLLKSNDEILDCYVDERFDPSLAVILKLYINRQCHREMLISKNQTIEDFQKYLSRSLEIETIAILQKDKVLNGMINDSPLSDNEKIIGVTQEDINMYVYPISEKSEPVIVCCANEELVSDFKVRIAQKLKYNINEFILFMKNNYLDERKHLYEYQYLECSTVKYCFFNKVDSWQKIGLEQKTGTFSIVYPAKIKKTGEVVIIKQYNCEKQKCTIEDYKPMISELISFDIIDPHENLVQLKDFYFDDGIFYIGMEYMRGGSIHQFVRENWPLSEFTIGHFARQILQGLDQLHRKNIMHRNLKSSNVMLDENLTNVKISGFGLSKYLMGETSTALSQGFNASSVSFSKFIAPEILNYEKSGIKVDIWLLGTILVELVTGKPLYHGMNESDIHISIASSEKIDYNRQGISIELQNLMDVCLQKDPKLRQRAKDLLENNDFILKHYKHDNK